MMVCSFTRRFFLAMLSLGTWWGLVSCGKGPETQKTKPQGDTPEFVYNQAKEAFSEIKVEKAMSLINEVLSRYPKSIQAQRARILQIVLFNGLSDGYQDLADAYLTGFEKGGKYAGPLRSGAFDFYRKKKNAVLGFKSACDYMVQNYSNKADFLLECDFPAREASRNRLIEEVKIGKLLDPERLKLAEEQELHEGILISISFFLGTEGDRNKARRLLEEGSRPLDPAGFYVRCGRIFLESQKLFGRKYLNEMQYYQLFFQNAKECWELAQEILKERPNPETQMLADQLGADLARMEKGKV